jgi:hypothetical protein
VPALPGLHFSLDGSTLTTGPDGTARYTAEHNLSSHQLTLLSTSADGPARRYRFDRWAGQRDPRQAFRPTVTGLPLRADYTVTAGFDVLSPVRPDLRDQHGARLDPTSVSGLQLRSSTGRLVDLPSTGDTWLPADRAVYRNGGLALQPISYRLQRMKIGGADPIDAGAQSFRPDRTRSPVLTGQFADLAVTGRDALYGGGVGSHTEVTGPDGQVHTAILGPGHRAVIRHLPRGDYRVNVVAAGTVFDQAIRLTQDSSAEIPVAGPADLATVGGAAAAGIALLLLARRHGATALAAIRRRRRRHPDAPHPESEPQPEKAAT